MFIFLSVSALLLASGSRAAPPPLGPGGKIGSMTLARGPESQASIELWKYYDAVLPTPGHYRRTCTLPSEKSLFIGWGDWEQTPKALDAAWKQLKYELWFDGHQINLSRFGASDRLLYSFPAAGGKNVILREWSVILRGLTPGKHVIRYRSESSLGTTDATWTFTVLG